MFRFLLYATITVMILASFGLIRGLPEENQLSYLMQQATSWVSDTEQDVTREAQDLKRDAGF